MPAENIAPVILVVGSDSLIGGALIKQLERAGKRAVGTTRRRETTGSSRLFLDLSKDVQDWQSPWPVSAAVICAGITKIEDCRRDPASTSYVNVQSVVKLIRKLTASGAFVIYLSTNQVFDGSIPCRSPDDATSPQTEYGRQKAEVECYLTALSAEAASIVRLTKVLGPGAPLLRGWLHALRSGEVIHPFKDMVMSPVSLSFVVTVLERIVETRLPGIVQVSAATDVTYAEVAYYLAEGVGANRDLVQPVSSREAGVQAESTPQHTTLDTTRLRAKLGLEPPDVWTTIEYAVSL